MDSIIWFLSQTVVWFFTETIYGIAVIAGIAYGVAKLVRLPRPEIPAVIVAGVALFFLPSYARYKFEKDSYAKLAKHPEYKIVQTTYWGDVTEPLTWFHSFVGHFRAVAPDPTESGEGQMTFKGIVLRYEEEPREWIYEVYCRDNEMSSATPDNKGTFRLTSKDWQPISAEDRRVFCDTDWSKQTRYLLEKP